MNKNVLYRSIPKVDILLADEGIKVLIEAYSRESVMEAIHSEMEKLRAYIGTCDDEEKAKHQIALLNENIAKGAVGYLNSIRVGAGLNPLEYEKGDQRNRNDPAYESRTCTDQLRTHDESSRDRQWVFQSGIQSGSRKKRRALFAF